MIRNKIKNVLHVLWQGKDRSSLLRASLFLASAINEAKKKNKKDGHRYFVIWDPAQRKLISITYDIYKGRGDSYQYLSRRGRFISHISRRNMQESCFFYTGSKNGAPECHGAELNEKTVEWQKYYMKLKKSDRIPHVNHISWWKVILRKLHLQR